MDDDVPKGGPRSILENARDHLGLVLLERVLSSWPNMSPAMPVTVRERREQIMSPFGKIVTIGIALVTGTSLLTGVTTAYMLRSTVPADNMVATSATAPVPRASATRVVPAVSRTSVDTPRPIPVATTASECATGGDRAWRIAKPGAIGA